jgi:hypothetical protein
MYKIDNLVERECFKKVLKCFKSGYRLLNECDTYEPPENIIRKDELKTFVETFEKVEIMEISRLSKADKMLIEREVYFYKIERLKEKMYLIVKYLAKENGTNIDVLIKYLKIFEKEFGIM